MIKFGMQREVARFAESMRFVPREQMPFAIALALTRTAQQAVPALQAEFRRTLDRPTPWTLNSVRIKPATKRNLEAEVALKDEGGSPAARYLGPQQSGGDRVLKRFERALLARRLLPAGMYVVPGAGAKLDGYGNISRGQIVQILSALGAAENVSGFAMNRTEQSKARRKGKLAEYFVGRPSSGKGPLGIWQRFGFAVGSAIKPVMIFVRRPQYKKRIEIYGAIEEVANMQFPGNLERAIAETMSTRR